MLSQNFQLNETVQKFYMAVLILQLRLFSRSKLVVSSVLRTIRTEQMSLRSHRIDHWLKLTGEFLPEKSLMILKSGNNGRKYENKILLFTLFQNTYLLFFNAQFLNFHFEEILKKRENPDFRMLILTWRSQQSVK